MNIFNDDDLCAFLKKDFDSFEATTLRGLYDNSLSGYIDVSRCSAGS